jgi:cytochrome P450
MFTSADRSVQPVLAGRLHLALLEMKMAMAVLLQHFDITAVDTPDGQPPAEQLNFTMTPVGLRMRLQRRAAAPA